MRLLRNFTQGEDVRAWQSFLIGRGFDPKGSDGKFGADTEAATKAFQSSLGLPPNGTTDVATLAAAARFGFPLVTDPGPLANDPDWPKPPAGLQPLVSNEDRARVFGRFAFVHAPLPDNPENIRITDGWEAQNVVSVPLPQLMRAANRSRVRFHRLAAAQLQALWAEWEASGLLDRVLSWGGSFVPRFVRGSTSTLSNHAFATAFDINMGWNGLNKVPAGLGETGCVRELVAAANKHGFYWGGHFRRLDGMHFEVAKIIP